MPNDDDAMGQGPDRTSANCGIGGLFARGAHADGRAIACHIADLVKLAGRVEQVRQAAVEAEARRQDSYLDALMGQGYSFQTAQALVEEMWAQDSEWIPASENASVAEHDAAAETDLYREEEQAAMECEEDLYFEESADCAFDQDDSPNPVTLRLYAPEALDAALRQIGKDRDRRVVRSFLSELGERGPDRELALAPWSGIWPALAQRFPNFTEVFDYLAGRAALAHLQPCSPLQFPPLLIEGEPGIGKTAFATALADAMAVPFIVLPMAHSNGPFMLGGLDASFEGGGPGLLARSVALGKAIDPVVLLDEIDKVSLRPNHDPLGPLYSLWESHTAERFQDEGLPLTLNLSAVRWIATANGSEGLHPALRSRCQVFRIPAPTPEQAKGIARRVYADLVAQQPWGRHFEAELPEAVADLLAQSTPRELRRRLTDAFAMAARAQRRALQVSDVPAIPPASRRTGFL